MMRYIKRPAGPVGVFKTGIEDSCTARTMEQKLLKYFPDYRIDFDLQDCDNVLRIEAPEGTIDSDRVIELVSGAGYNIEILP